MAVWNSEDKLIIFKILHKYFAKNVIFGYFYEKFENLRFFKESRADTCCIWIYKVKYIKIKRRYARELYELSRRKPGWRFTAGAHNTFKFYKDFLCIKLDSAVNRQPGFRQDNS